MTIFRRRNQIRLEGLSGTATRALYQMPEGMLPKIEFRFKTPTESVEIEMTIEEATKFIQQGINAIDAATPPIPRPAHYSPFG